ncbi:MAG: esterase-like activity of phytase family protein [Pseudomonadota bacterium]
MDMRDRGVMAASDAGSDAGAHAGAGAGRGAGRIAVAASLAVAVGTAVAGLAVPAAAEAGSGAPALRFIGAVEIEPGTEYGDTVLGGISGAVARPGGGLLAVSDDRDAGPDGPPRVYGLSVDLSDGRLDEGDVAIDAVHLLTTETGAGLDTLKPDPEGIALAPDGMLWISSERDTAGRPSVTGFRDFSAVETLDVPEAYMPGEGRGVRDNSGFESLTITPDATTMWVAIESALVQDGAKATTEAGTAIRVLRYDLPSRRLEAEFRYVVDPIARVPVPADSFADSGLTEMMALADGTLLMLERSFSVGTEGRGFTCLIYHVDPAGAVPLAEGGGALEKTLVLDLAETGAPVDNMEALAFGPVLPDGRASLLVLSDDNFVRFGKQSTVIMAFAIE